jgi:hypothetical protein
MVGRTLKASMMYLGKLLAFFLFFLTWSASIFKGFRYAFPCPLYLDTFLSLGPRVLLALPAFLLPKLIFLLSPDDFDFAITY